MPGAVVEESPIIYSDPGMSNANMQLVHVNVDPACADPQQHLDDGEFLDVLLFPYDNLLHHITLHATVRNVNCTAIITAIMASSGCQVCD